MRTLYILLVVFLILSAASITALGKAAESIKVAAAAAEIVGDDSMEIAGGISPGHVVGQEGKLRASAVVIEANIKVCIVSCDVLVLQRDILALVDSKCMALKNEAGHDEQTQKGMANALLRVTSVLVFDSST